MDATLDQVDQAIRDRRRRPIGAMQGWIPSERTDEPAQLSVTLRPEIQEELSAPTPDLLLDGGLVWVIRRDEILLDRTAEELRELLADKDAGARCQALKR